MNYKVGQVISTDHRNLEHTLKVWKDTLVPAIFKVAEEFNNLSTGTFNQEVYDLVVANKLSDIEAQYADRIRAEADKLKVKALLKPLADPMVIAAGFQEFRKAVIQFLNLLGQPAPIGITMKIFPEDCTIVKGEPVLNENSIVQRFELTIENETQIEYLTFLEHLKVSFDSVKTFVSSNLPDRNGLLIVGDEYTHNKALTVPGEDGQLQIDLYSIELFK